MPNGVLIFNKQPVLAGTGGPNIVTPKGYYSINCKFCCGSVGVGFNYENLQLKPLRLCNHQNGLSCGFKTSNDLN